MSVIRLLTALAMCTFVILNVAGVAILLDGPDHGPIYWLNKAVLTMFACFLIWRGATR
ncbi:hypothetical protein KFK14_12790 [Sphingobium phenoxybenzoativorans]|uniref:Uncharacterized protein n=1 Tax=Sphingobium phenoxybenzoativorans TaxID=1592790 RepID=A0A975K4L6_9SPHN|nr:hypothetical protein [Sphingobium phenoxybenzoativorans]QUT04023.1 hypothetical protein KFK14_12790 [Sphingobium phenoxybenzoativorans]